MPVGSTDVRCVSSLWENSNLFPFFFPTDDLRGEKGFSLGLSQPFQKKSGSAKAKLFWWWVLVGSDQSG